MTLGKEVLSVLTDIIENIPGIDRTPDPRRSQMPARPCEPNCTCGLHRKRLTDEQRRQKRQQKQHRRYWSDPEASRVAARDRRAADPDKAREIDRRSKDKNREARNARNRGAANAAKRLRDTHGMTPLDVARMTEAQSGRCCYCERPLPGDQKQVHIDHDHSCTCGPKRSCRECRRGLACGACNTLIGLADEDWSRLERIIANGRRLQAEARQRISAMPVQADLFQCAAPDQAELFDNVRRLERREESA